MSLSEQLHHAQLCSYAKVGRCNKGALCKFAHHLGELIEPTQQFLKSHQTRNFNKWSSGEILPNKEHILDTISWAIWDMEQGSNPPDWILNLHWRCTIESRFEYLKEVAALVEAYGPKKLPCSRSPEPHTADDGEGGAKTEGRQPHERWHSRKRKKSPSAAAPPQKKKRPHHGTSKERHRDEKRHHHGTSKERHGDGCGISKEHHSDHRRTSKEHRRDRDHRGISKEEPPTRKRPQPGELPEVRGHSPESFPKEDHPTRRRARSIPQVRNHSPESYSYDSSYYP